MIQSGKIRPQSAAERRNTAGGPLSTSGGNLW